MNNGVDSYPCSADKQSEMTSWHGVRIILFGRHSPLQIILASLPPISSFAPSLLPYFKHLRSFLHRMDTEEL